MDGASHEVVSLALFGDFKNNLGAILASVAITFIWAVLWPSWIKDEDGQRLPRSSLARSAFALSIVLIYLVLLSAAFLLPGVFKHLSSPTVDAVIKHIGTFLGAHDLRANAPFGIVILMGILYNIPQTRELLERWAYFLYASQYNRDDELQLQNHFQNCEFDISDEELRLNRAYIEQFDVFVTDNNPGVIPDETVSLWRKTSALVRLAESDIQSEHSVLSTKDIIDLERLQQAHRRKTRLAMNIVRLLDQLGSDSPKFARIASTLSDASHGSRPDVEAAEEVVSQITGAEFEDVKLGEIQGPLRLSSRQLSNYLAQIGGYFHREYQMILGEISRLAAKVIVRAGDEAPKRLDAVKRAGFMGLGTIEKQSFDGVLSVLLVTWTVVFTSFLIAGAARGMQVKPSLVFSIALTVSVAATIGSVWGARRTLVERRDIPWSSYLSAGFLAVVVFCLVHGIRFAWDPEAATQMMTGYRENAEAFTPLQFLAEIWPFSISLVFLVVGICALARARRWRWAQHSRLRERLTDGVFVGLIYACGNIASMITHYSLQTVFGERLKDRLAEGNVPVAMLIVSFIVGFVIGFAVLREVRRIAHSHVIDRTDPHGGIHAQGQRFSQTDGPGPYPTPATRPSIAGRDS